jgi:hypothetical protein
VELTEWRERHRSNARLIAELAEQPHVVRRKPRTPEEHAALERAALSAIRRRVAEGRLVRIGPRRYEVRS